jgi:hypothetical protein
MIGLAAALLWAVIAGGMCYLLARRRTSNNGGQAERVDKTKVPPPTITRITTTPKNDVVAP